MDYLECDQEYVYGRYAHSDSHCDLVNTRFDSCRLELGISLPLSNSVFLESKECDVD